MTGGTGPPPPLGNHPNGIDISHPNYAFTTDTWHEPPRQFPESFINSATMTLRTTNDSAYKKVGNPTTWNRYLILGYHAYDHCFQFDTQWERMKNNEADALKFIWEVYSYHVSRSIAIPTQLERWAHDIARPFLTHNLPDALKVDTTDPRQARRKYSEADLMDIEDDDRNRKPAAIETPWNIVGAKQRSKVATDATTTPLPASPARQPSIVPLPTLPSQERNASTAPNTTPGTKPNADPQFVRLNDGTLRITVKWRPRNFDELEEDSGKWEYAATDLIHYMLSTADDATIHRWMHDKTGLLPAIPSIPSLELSPDNLLQYIAPRVTKLSSVKMFIFSFRISLATGHGRWINNQDTKNIMAHNNVEANVSNSSSDSGDTIPTVGYIFFKHPKFAHRLYYLIHLRKQLPDETPFFDIGFHRKTPTGKDIPHLSIRCGENHAATLTEILSTYLDGSHHAVFLGRLLLSQMTTEEVDSIFQTHADFMQNTRSLSLSPIVQNVDRIRTEYQATGNIERSTREWAKALTDLKGNNLKCDVENGGSNLRAQMLVPLEHYGLAKKALEEYKECVSPFSQRESNFTNRVIQAHPLEIYVPTVAAHKNLDLIKNLSSTTIWQQAPAAVRTPPTQQSRYQPLNNSPPTSAVPPLTQPPATAKLSDHSNTCLHQDFDYLHQPGATDDTATTHSQMTKSLATTQQKFNDIEAAIRRQNKEIKTHQLEFGKVNQRFDDLDLRGLQTLQFCQEASQNVLELRQETSNNISSMRHEANEDRNEVRNSLAHMAELIQSLTAQMLTARTYPTGRGSETSVNSDSNHSSTKSEMSDNMSIHSTDVDLNAFLAHSPEKKKSRKRNSHDEPLDSVKHNLNPKPPPDQDSSGQHNPPCTPDGGAK